MTKKKAMVIALTTSIILGGMSCAYSNYMEQKK